MNTLNSIGQQLSLSRTRSTKQCAFCHAEFTGIKVARYCSESCRQKAKYLRNKTRTERNLPLSQLVGTRRPYDWSNPNMPEKAFIISVLKGGCLEDITKATLYFGSKKMQEALCDLDHLIEYRIAERKLNNVIQAREDRDAKDGWYARKNENPF